MKKMKGLREEREGIGYNFMYQAKNLFVGSNRIGTEWSMYLKNFAAEEFCWYCVAIFFNFTIDLLFGLYFVAIF